MHKFYVSTAQGCVIYTAPSLEQARAQALREVGTRNYEFARPATQEELDWVAAMGGRV